MSKTIIRCLPLIALRGNVILPGMVAHFDVGREKSIRAVEEAMQKDQKIFVVAQRDPETDEPGRADLFDIGTAAHIRQIVKLPKNMVRVLVEGVCRAELLSLNTDKDYLTGEIRPIEETGLPDEAAALAYSRQLKELFAAYSAADDNISGEIADNIMGVEDLSLLVEQIGNVMTIPWEKRQALLEAATTADLCELLCVTIENEIRVLTIRRELNQRIKKQLDNNQKEYVLREQMKVISEELGEDNTKTDADKFRERCELLTASDEIKDKIREEIGRYARMASQSPEANVMYGYLDTLLKMPWDKKSEDREDLKAAKAILDRDHFGMDQVKDRILEFLSVRFLTKKGRSPILCLVGPPGTGKTSIARSVAEALDRKYVRLSLGGVHDEAEIRGHRRTYVGAMPGRIAAALKTAGVKNPLIVLDEIDKVSANYKGETASALLEVLDSEQNSRFEDHYIELPIDLSEVLFLTTANDASAIPQPLYDRMEVIEVSSYTENEKMHIAREHLLPKQIEANGLVKKQLSISDKALSEIITGYTREAGVRSLERRLGQICRKAARLILEEGRRKVSVTDKNLKTFLGQPRGGIDKINKKDEIGIVRGLAWTAVGGDTLEIEVNVMPGKGELVLTGQLGDVMKESARAGISWIRSEAGRLGIDDDSFTKKDIHIHIPEGAVPKDGPSAGITMALAMVSALTGQPVHANVAMTGEITLRGRVLPIGGLKEKLLAAKKAGVVKVLVPESNKNQIAELSSEITDGLKIVYVSSMSQVLKEALVKA